VSARSSIEWTDDTWNPIRAELTTGEFGDGQRKLLGWHCEHVSEGCRHCYAESFNRRLGTKLDYKPGHRQSLRVFVDETMLLAPLKWRKPRKIFVCSMTDLFADFVSDNMLDQVFAIMALSPQHVFQVLTKRPERLRAYVQAQAEGSRHVGDHVDIWQTKGLIPEGVDTFGGWIGSPDRPRPLPNVWLGVSVEDQAAADERIPLLLETPAAMRWLSCEPLLGPVDLGYLTVATPTGPEQWDCLDRDEGARAADEGGCGAIIDWVVAGGESGPRARPMHPAWARSMRDQCAAASVPFLFKQWGAWGPVDRDAGHIIADEQPMAPIGKKRAGRLLDGVQHDGYPA